jgi:hypothetical protein
MAFGQQSGPPASTKEVAHLEALLAEAGYSSFKEARHIYGLTQRQASGRFTRDEASELLARLASGEGQLDAATASAVVEETADAMASGRAAADRAAKRAAHRHAEQVAALPDDLLADELVRRGWVCIPPG